MIWFKLPDRLCCFFCSLLASHPGLSNEAEDDNAIAGECRRSGAEDGDLNGPSFDLDDREAVLAN